MTPPLRLFHRVRSLGLSVEADEDSPVVKPKSKCPSGFVAELKQHKAELLALLEAKAGNLPADCAPGLHVAKQVFAGDFDGSDRSTAESLTTGLRRIEHPSCRLALQRLYRGGYRTKT